MKIKITITFLIFLTMANTNAQTITNSFSPAKDNTIFSEGPTTTSNGAGEYIFAGATNGGDIRRALLQFDLSSIPEGVLIDSASLKLSISKSIAGDKNASIHALIRNWGEGNSDASGQEGTGSNALADDATWNYMFFESQSWDTPGGDFESVPSASALAGNTGDLVFKSAEMAANINMWLNSPEANFGWIVIVDESSSPSSKRFYSKENASVSSRPELTVYYEKPTSFRNYTRDEVAFSIYHNSVSNKISVESLIMEGDFTLRIFDITGALLLDKTQFLAKGRNTISYDFTKQGMYIISISGSGHQFVEKIIHR